MRPESEDADPRDTEYLVAIGYGQEMLPPRRSRKLIARQWGKIPKAPTPEERRRQGGPLS